MATRINGLTAYYIEAKRNQRARKIQEGVIFARSEADAIARVKRTWFDYGDTPVVLYVATTTVPTRSTQ